MNNKQKQENAKKFAAYWKGRGYEKGDSQPFWLALLRDILGVAEPEKLIRFEDKVMLDHTSFIDAVIPSTHVMIEQKELNKNLRKAIRQSDGSLLTPFQQAKRYSANMPYSQRPRYIVTCNFASFLIYDMEKPQGEPEEILLENLPTEYYRLNFLVNHEDKHIQKELEISVQAGTLVGKLYNALLKQYINPQNEQSLKSLNILCVRLVFCLYAEDAEIFGARSMFHDYLAQFQAKDMRRAVIDLFKILDTEQDKRDPYINDDLNAFPFVNGGLFSDEDIEIPQFTEEIRELLLVECSEQFDWSEISPTIFGALFESTLNPQTRRSGGMHYTSIENIHKVIDPLFLDDLKAELSAIKEMKKGKKRNAALEKFQQKLSELIFLDPACGSGNFLTETYLSLRRLENEILAELLKTAESGATLAGLITDVHAYDLIKVSINQFYGIEINDFAVTVAKAALWIAESQMMKETENIVNLSLDFLPLKTNAYIMEGNALRIDWNEVVPKEKLNYIMGNPPFVGARLMIKSQKEDINMIFTKWKGVGNLDYVSCWYKKCSDFMFNTDIHSALVSTNSITQGEAVAILWKPLFEQGVHFDFAHKTFIWDNEANNKAHVHCVIIGFSHAINSRPKKLYSNDRFQIVDNINGYLLNAPNIFVTSRKKVLCNVPEMVFGNMPNDSGYLSNYSAEQKNEIVARYPKAEPLFKKFVGAVEFLHNKERYCIWLKDISPSKFRSIPPIMQAIENVRQVRENSKRLATKKLALTPYLFGEIRQLNINSLSNYIAVPKTSSENRKYIPIGFLPANIIASDLLFIIPCGTLYDFGIITSNVHMAWMRAICGRLEMRYRYSINIVYNNFPWCTPTPQQKAKIEQTAQAILDARALYPDSSLADLYDELTMPKELRRAHQENDKAVMTAYGFDWRKMTESDCVAELMKMYQKLTANEKKKD